MAVAIFDPSAFTPMVLQLTPAPGQSVTGVAIEVVLRSCTNCEKNLSTAEFELLPPWEIPFEGGRLLYSEWKGQYGAMWPLYSAAANASGAITFPYLLLMGGRQNRIFQVCYQYGMRHTACEKGYFRTARNLKVEVVKEMSTVAVPGVAVRNPPIALPAAEDGTPIPTLVLAAVVDEYISPAKLDTSTAFAMATDAGATFQGLKFRRSSQHGKCNLKFLVPGAESPATMGITLTQQPSQIRFAIPPRPYVLVGGSASQVAIASVRPLSYFPTHPVSDSHTQPLSQSHTPPLSHSHTQPLSCSHTQRLSYSIALPLSYSHPCSQFPAPIVSHSPPKHSHVLLLASLWDSAPKIASVHPVSYSPTHSHCPRTALSHSHSQPLSYSHTQPHSFFHTHPLTYSHTQPLSHS